MATNFNFTLVGRWFFPTNFFFKLLIPHHAPTEFFLYIVVKIQNSTEQFSVISRPNDFAYFRTLLPGRNCCSGREAFLLFLYPLNLKDSAFYSYGRIGSSNIWF